MTMAFLDKPIYDNVNLAVISLSEDSYVVWSVDNQHVSYDFPFLLIN